MCDNNLVEGVDFNWTTTRTTFSVQWGLYCSKEAINTQISSVYFIGSLVGMLSLTAIYDQIGRKRGAWIGAVISMCSIGVSAVAPNYKVMILSRIITGFGQIIQSIGYFFWVLEFSPKSLRNFSTEMLLLSWSGSYFLLIALSYISHDWQYIYIGIAAINAISLLPLIILPDSPRFHLIRGMDKEAKKTLELLSRIAGNYISMDNITLIPTARPQNFFGQIKDFKIYPTMLKETLITMFTWFLISAVAHSYHFSWSKIGSNIYASYALAAMGETIILLSTVPICKLLGRKKTAIFYLTCTIVCNLVAMINVKIYKEWTLEFVASVVGSMSINGVYNMMYLMTIERAPSSHCGMILSLASAMARAGCFLGPQVNLLYGITTRRVPLGMYAGMALVSIFGILMLPNTTGMSIPETPTATQAGINSIINVDSKIKEEVGQEKGEIYKNPWAT